MAPRKENNQIDGWMDVSAGTWIQSDGVTGLSGNRGQLSWSILGPSVILTIPLSQHAPGAICTGAVILHCNTQYNKALTPSSSSCLLNLYLPTPPRPVSLLSSFYLSPCRSITLLPSFHWCHSLFSASSLLLSFLLPSPSYPSLFFLTFFFHLSDDFSLIKTHLTPCSYFPFLPIISPHLHFFLHLHSPFLNSF